MWLDATRFRELILNENLISKPSYDTDEEWQERVGFIEGNQFDLTIDRLFVAKDQDPLPFIGKYSRELYSYDEIEPVYDTHRREFVWTLDAGKHYLGMTGELVYFPDFIKGVLAPRSSCFTNGFLPWVTWISPGFCGKLRFGIGACATSMLARGARVITLNAYELKQASTQPYAGVWGKSGGFPDKITTDGVERAH